jgi:hypothetical protein
MFCHSCGTSVKGLNFCSKCGTAVKAATPQPQPAYQQQPQPAVQQPVQPQPAYQPPQPAYQQPQPYPYQPKVRVHYAPGGFAERLHSHSGSILFLIGICLFTAGSLISLFMSFSIFSIFSLLLLALPVTGFWLMFAAAKAPVLPEKTLPALTLFKVSIIIDLVVSCIGAFFLVIGAIFSFIGAAASGELFVFILAFVMFLIAGGVVTFIIIYFKAVLNTIGSIREGLTTNFIKPLRGVNIFTILTYIGVGFSIIGSIVTMVVLTIINNTMGSIDYFLRYELDMPREIVNIVSGMLPDFTMQIVATFFTIVTSAGIVLCLVTLNLFNRSLTHNR